MSSESTPGPRPHSAPRPGLVVSAARAEASRANGARSRGPRTAAGKARSSRNALRHGLCAQKCLVLPEEDPAAFRALEAALLAELAPAGALQGLLARQLVSAAWRLARSEQIEADMFRERRCPTVSDYSPGLGMIRDGNNSRSFETLLRYRGAAMTELLRALKALRALQAEADPAPARRRRGRPIVRPNEPEKARRINDLAPQATAAAGASQPLASGRDLVATARPPLVPSTIPDERSAESLMPPALAALLAATKRTRATAPAQDLAPPAEP
jgi:hypothetical protein